MTADERTCAGPLLWFDVADHDAILECTACSYIIVAGNFHNEAHAGTEMLRAA